MDDCNVVVAEVCQCFWKHLKAIVVSTLFDEVWNKQMVASSLKVVPWSGSGWDCDCKWPCVGHLSSFSGQWGRKLEHKRLPGRVLVSRQMRSELCPFNAGKWALHLGHLFGVLVFQCLCPCRCLYTNKQGQRQGLRLSTHSSPTGWQEPKRGRKTHLRCQFCLVAFCCVFEPGLCKIFNWRTGSLSVHSNVFELNWNDRKRKNLLICNSKKCHLSSYLSVCVCFSAL